MLNNITSDMNGNVNIAYVDNKITLFGDTTESVIGRSVVIHQNPDDLGIYRFENSERGEKSRTTGNAGKRIACAIIGISKDDFHP